MFHCATSVSTVLCNVGGWNHYSKYDFADVVTTPSSSWKDDIKMK